MLALSPAHFMVLTLLAGTSAIAQSDSAPRETLQEDREVGASSCSCQAELMELRAMQARPDGLLGMREAGLMDEGGVSAHTLYPGSDFTQPINEALDVKRATVYRSRGRVGMELKVRNTGPRPWMVARAELVGPGGVRMKVLRVWPLEPLLPGATRQRVFVEAEWAGDLPPGPYTLELWDADGQRTVSLQGMTFP